MVTIFFTGDITGSHRAPELWSQGVTGAGIKVAVFDTGVRSNHPHFRNVEERLNWTDEPSLGDGVGHGSFVAGVIASHKACLGFAPDASLYTFRVFTNAQISFTSWFLDAFNYAIQSNMDVLNLSIGGPDFLDQPFVDKINELSANNVVIVSAIGNDGPSWGTLNSPADQPDVIGVGGIDNNFRTARFSSRGMTTWELPYGYGRMKPDIVTFSVELRGSAKDVSPNGVAGCRRLGGTSAASPVVAGAVALLASSIPYELRTCLLNPASIKQALVESARPIRESAVSKKENVASIFEQGAGLMNLPGAYKILQQFVVEENVVDRDAARGAEERGAEERGAEERDSESDAENSNSGTRPSVHPSNLDLTDCPYMWPYCSQPLYYSGMPIIFNLTVLNSMGVVGNITAVRWNVDEEVEDDIAVGKEVENAKKQEYNRGHDHKHASSNGEGEEEGEEEGEKGEKEEKEERLLVRMTHSAVLWPYSGHLSLFLTVAKGSQHWSGIVTGTVTVTVRSEGDPYNGCPMQEKETTVKLKVRIGPTPKRKQRILWDTFHNIRYPPTFIPRDDLEIVDDVLDWHADHPHTNHHDAFDTLIAAGYFVEILGYGDLTCFDASLYGVLMLVDSEEEYYPQEILKLKQDVEDGLSIVLFSDWYDVNIISKIKFFDENTRDFWEAATGGANVPAINELLSPYGIAFGGPVVRGLVRAGGSSTHTTMYRSGNGLIRFPLRGRVARRRLSDES